MVPDWQKQVQRRIDLSNIAQAVAAGLGAAFAIGGMEWSSLASHYPLVLIPFATSIVLVVGSPDAEPAQPRALVGGHLVATLVAPVLAGALLLTVFAYLWHRLILGRPWPLRWL